MFIFAAILTGSLNYFYFFLSGLFGFQNLCNIND